MKRTLQVALASALAVAGSRPADANCTEYRKIEQVHLIAPEGSHWCDECPDDIWRVDEIRYGCQDGAVVGGGTLSAPFVCGCDPTSASLLAALPDGMKTADDCDTCTGISRPQPDLCNGTEPGDAAPIDAACGSCPDGAENADDADEAPV